MTVLSTLGGLAGSVAGLFPYLPYIVAGVVVAGALGWGALQAHDAEVQRQQNASLQANLDTANHNLGVDKSVIDTDEATIASMLANDRANDTLIAEQTTEIDNKEQQAADAAAAIRTLQANDQTVDAYLKLSIPASLRSLLNDGRPASAASATDKDGNTAAAKAK